jgi:flagellar hook-basal body complex protein FliE
MTDKIHAGNIQSILSQIRQYELHSKAPAEPAATAGAAAKTGFGEAVKGAIDSVNELQRSAQSLATAFEQGKDVPLTDVMLAMQKSSIAFEATLQIRNKVMRAYEDIRNMPV